MMDPSDQGANLEGSHSEESPHDLSIDNPALSATSKLGDASLSSRSFTSSREAKLQMLAEMQRDVEKVARGYGLDCFPQHFEVVDYEQLKIVVAQVGFPKKYLHMRNGLEYEQYHRKYTYGLQKVYELVINNDPCVAYLLDSNSMQEQRMVMAHVYGHNDFFKNNAFFRATDRKMLDTMGEHATQVQRLMNHHGEDKIESLFDACLSIDDLLDPRTIVSGMKKAVTASPLDREEGIDRPARAKRYEAPSEYMDSFINPPEVLRAENERLAEEHRNKRPEPERDVLLFLLENAPLASWEQEVLSIVRDEAYYFAPQRMTKIMNEGWASYWHNKMMTEVLLQSHNDELLDYACSNAGVLHQPHGGLNPYRIGVKIFEDIEDRWNKGKFGEEWENCDDMHEKAHWDKQLGLGRKKIFEVRAAYNDVTFIREFLTPELVDREKLFVYKKSEDSYEIASRQFEEVKDKLITGLVNGGRPIIQVLSGNYKNAKELLLEHVHEGRDLDQERTRAVLENVQRLWKRPVNIVSEVDGNTVCFRYDGEEHEEILGNIRKN